MARLIADPPKPRDPQLRSVTEDVLSKLRYSFASVAAMNQPPRVSGGLDQVFRSYFASRSEASRARFREQSRALLAAPGPIRDLALGRYGVVDLQEYRSLGSDKLAERVGKLVVEPDAAKAALDSSSRAVLSLSGGKAIQEAADLKAGLAFKTMTLFIERVVCVEEGELMDDEINMGGNATDPFGNTTLISQFKIHHDFDTGEQVVYEHPGRVFHTWNLETNKEGFPYVYAAVISIGEKDDGGFYKFLKDLWEKVQAEVIAAIGAGVGAAIGAAIGATLGLGIGAIVGAVVGAFLGWIIGLFDDPDDIIGTQSLVFGLGAATKSYYDEVKLTPGGWKDTLTFKSSSHGHYEVDYAYRLS